MKPTTDLQVDALLTEFNSVKDSPHKTISFFESNFERIDNIDINANTSNYNAYFKFIEYYCFALYSNGNYKKVLKYAEETLNLYNHQSIKSQEELFLINNYEQLTWLYSQCLFATKEYTASKKALVNLVEFDPENDKYRKALINSEYSEFDERTKAVNYLTIIWLVFHYLFLNKISPDLYIKSKIINVLVLLLFTGKEVYLLWLKNEYKK